ncbi:MAG TPA: hypothetical protein DDZ96_01320 [Porphyromonadaceae bacterium]|jgi:hypothetical protein|nr:hypothetical protein [Porphyromonadaceae bacterium]HBX21777.1 hypothetical protein [Porphyromonadaceae bacterium]HCM20765.1 hypothetical protein [Porphyromonadaceae bacterium]
MMIGDYYNRNGYWLGRDKFDDNKVYLADAVNKDAKGLVTEATNKQELSISHDDFRKQAATVYAESSAYKKSTVSDNLQKEMYSIASIYQRNNIAYGADAPKSKEYLSLTPEKINESSFKTTSNAAVINALTGGFDYSFGANMWDAREQALFHYATWKANIGKNFRAPQIKVSPANYGAYKNKGK